MSNALDHEKQQQILALGRLGWTLRRIEEATGIRRETVSGYLRAAGVAVRGRGGKRKEWPPKPAITPEVSTDRTLKTGHHRDGVHRPWATLSTWARAECECLRAVPGGDYRGPGPWPQRPGHLARPRRRSRIHRTLRQCPTIRADAARRHAGRGARGDHHLPRGGLW